MSAKNLLFFILIFFSGALFATPSPTLPSSQKKLQKVSRQISNLQITIKNEASKKKLLETQLKDDEIKINDIEQSLEQIAKQLTEQQIKLKQLKIEQQHYQSTLENERDLLAEQLRAAYLLSRETNLKMLLNQEQPAQIERMLTYYQYVDKIRLCSMQQLRDTLFKLVENQRAIHDQTHQLHYLQQIQQQEQQQLQQTRASRAQVVQALNQQLVHDKTHLQKLQTEKNELSRLITHLLQQASTKTFLGPQYPFIQMQGKLSWPTQGKLQLGFRGGKEHNDINMTGVIINAKEGQPVYTIYAGQVLFAGWLRGFGLLVIIDHGNGYMSLYGRNESLYHKVGDKVQTGELIARVGMSGGYEESGLYFGIRHNGKATDPAQWCRRNL